MEPDAFLVTWEVWSQVGLVPGLVVFGLSISFFALLDRAIGNRIGGKLRGGSRLRRIRGYRRRAIGKRIAGKLRGPRAAHVVPRLSSDGTRENCAAGSDGFIGEAGTADRGPGFA